MLPQFLNQKAAGEFALVLVLVMLNSLAHAVPAFAHLHSEIKCSIMRKEALTFNVIKI